MSTGIDKDIETHSYTDTDIDTGIDNIHIYKGIDIEKDVDMDFDDSQR